MIRAKLLSMTGLLALALAGGAETFHWTGSQDGAWTNANNWAEGTVPGRYLVPDGTGGFTTNGVLDSVVIFGDDLAGEKVTTIDFDGVYSVSNLLTTGSNAYTYGTDADQFIPIQIFGTFSGAELETTPVATVVGRLQTGVERTDHDFVKNSGLYGGETVKIRNNATDGVLDLTRWGWSTKRPDYAAYSHGGETGIRVEGKGTIRLGPTGQGDQPNPQFVMAMEGGLLQISGTFQARTFTVPAVTDTSERRVEILDGAVLRPVNYWYNWFSANRPVRIFGAGEFWCSAVGYNSSQPNKWATTGFIVSDSVTVECKVPATKYVSTKPTVENTGLDFHDIMGITGSGTLTFKGPVEVTTNEYFPNGVRYNLQHSTDASSCLALDRIGLRGTPGRHGNADFLLGSTSRLKYTGSGETMDRVISIGQKINNGKWSSPVGYLEHAGTGAFRVESLVTNELVVVTNAVGGRGRLVLVNSSGEEAVFAGRAETDVRVKGGCWTIDPAAVFEGELQVEGDASNLTRIDFGESVHLTTFRSCKGSVSTVFVSAGKTIEIDSFVADSGSAVDFVLELGASVKATEQSVAGGAVVRRSGRVAIFDENGRLVPDPSCPDNYWLAAADGLWSETEKWSKGVPSTAYPTFLDQAGADYTVTLSGETEIGDLTLSNPGSGTTTLSVDGTEAPAGLTLEQHRLTVNAGGQFVSGGAGATNVIAAYSTAALVTVADGGSVCVTGGLFQVIDRGNGASPLKGGSSVISLTGDATVEARDALVVHQGVPGNIAAYLTTKEGMLRFSGSAAFKAQSTYGCTYDSSLGPKNYTNDVSAKGSSVFYHGPSHTAGKTAVWEFVDDAYTDFSGTPWQLAVGDNNADGLSRVRFNTGHASEMNLWNSTRVGVRKGTGELLLERGKFKGGSYSIGVGIVDAGDKTATGASCVTGRLVVAENAEFYYPAGNGGLQNQSAASGYTGLNVGYALPLQADDQLAYGELIVEGKLKNEYGYLVVGAGPSGVGRVIQRGGDFQSQYNDWEREPWGVVGNTAASIGCFGGTGSYEMSGGTFKTHRSLYVGGVTTNILKKVHQNSAYFENYHSAKGLVDVSGGIFWVTNSIVLGLDGTGTLRLSGTGEVKAHSVVVSNTVGQASSSLEFVADAEGRFGTLSVSRLVFAEGSQLVVDAAALGENAKSKNLLSATDGIEGLAYAKAHADLRNAPSNASLVWSEDGRSLKLRMAHGTTLLVR